jgi:hypothetical protein
MDERDFGQYLKLTKNRFMVKTSETEFMVMSISDNKQLILSYSDIEIMKNRILEYIRYMSDNCGDMDAILERYLVKYCEEKECYIFAHKKNLSLAMGLKKDTIIRIVDFHKVL